MYQYVGNPFIIALNITNKNKITIPSINTETCIMIVWGDGVYEEIIDKHQIKHVYNNSGIFFAQLQKISFGYASELVEISQWGDLKLCDGFQTFVYCDNLNIKTLDKPDLKFATNLSCMFDNCS